jgi:hypothetical protein
VNRSTGFVLPSVFIYFVWLLIATISSTQLYFKTVQNSFYTFLVLILSLLCLAFMHFKPIIVSTIFQQHPVKKNIVLLNSIKDCIDSEHKGKIDTGLANMFVAFEDHLSKKDFKQIDQAIEFASQLAIPLNTALGVLSITLPATEFLPARNKMREYTSQLLASKGENPAEILKGL